MRNVKRSRISIAERFGNCPLKNRVFTSSSADVKPHLICSRTILSSSRDQSISDTSSDDGSTFGTIASSLPTITSDMEFRAVVAFKSSSMSTSDLITIGMHIVGGDDEVPGADAGVGEVCVAGTDCLEVADGLRADFDVGRFSLHFFDGDACELWAAEADSLRFFGELDLNWYRNTKLGTQSI